MPKLRRIALGKELQPSQVEPRAFAGHAARDEGELEIVVVHRHGAKLGAETLEAIEKDAHALVNFAHRNVVGVFATLKLKGDVAVITEWIDGSTLAEVRELTGRIPPAIALRIVLDVLDGLVALTKAGVAVGGLAPDDVIVGIDGVARLGRFWLGRARPILTDRHRVVHVAPEVLRGDAPDEGADVFTAGVLAWECTSGKNLFEPESVEEHLMRLEWDEIPRVPNTGPEITDIIARALRLDGGARTPSLATLARELGACLPIAPREGVATWVRNVAGGRIAERRSVHDTTRKLSLSPAAPPVTTSAQPPAVEPKPDESKPVLPKADESKPVLPKADESKPVLPKADESKPELPKPDPAKPKPEPFKPAPKPEPKPILKVDPKPAPKVEPKPQPKPEPKPQPKPEPKPQPKPHPKIEAKIEPVKIEPPKPKPESPVAPPAVAKPAPPPIPPPEPSVVELDETEALSIPPSAPLLQPLDYDEKEVPKPPKPELDRPARKSVRPPKRDSVPPKPERAKDLSIPPPPPKRSIVGTLFLAVVFLGIGFAAGMYWPEISGKTPAPITSAPVVSSAPIALPCSSTTTVDASAPDAAPDSSFDAATEKAPYNPFIPYVPQPPQDGSKTDVYQPAGI